MHRCRNKTFKNSILSIMSLIYCNRYVDVLLLWDAGCIDNDKLMLLLSKDKELPYHHKYDCFQLDNLEDLECRNLFRLSKDHLPILCTELGLKEEYHSMTRLKWSSLEGLCIML